MVNIPSEPSGRSPKEKKEEGSEKMTEPFEFSLDSYKHESIIYSVDVRSSTHLNKREDDL